MITDPGFGDDGWRDYHNLLAELHRRYESAFINCTWQQTRDRIGSFFAQMPHHHRMLVYENADLAGWADLRINDPGSDTQTGFFICDFLTDAPEQEMAEAIGKHILVLAGRYKMETIHSFSPSERLSRIVDWWRPRLMGSIMRYRLYRNKANMDAILQWVDEIPRQNPSLRLELFKTIPDKYIERYVELYGRFIEDMPTEDSEQMPFSTTVEEVRQQEKWRSENDAY
jgi:hypothetical protein